MWAEPSGVAIGVALTGFGIVLLAYLAYAAHLCRSEIMTDRPAVLREVLEDRGQWRT